MAVVMVIVGIVSVVRPKVVLTPQGVFLTRMKTTFIRWSEVKEVQVYRPWGSRHNMRFVRFVLGDGSKIRSSAPVDDKWDDQFDQKVRTIQQYHTQFGSPQPWSPIGRS